MTLPTPLLLPGCTVSGSGSLLQLAAITAPLGCRGVVVHGSAVDEALQRELWATFATGEEPTAWRHGGGEPTTGQVEELRDLLRRHEPAWVAAIGGGSVLDLAKAATGLLHAPGSVTDYQQGLPIPPATVPLIAVPTTAGTGSEATVVAVLTDCERGVKQSIRHPSFMPHTVILDATLLRSCPPATIAAAGMDAVTQAYESWISNQATDFTRDLARRALQLLTTSLPSVYDGDQSLAGELLTGSYLAGLALSHSRLGVVHGLAHPLGIRSGLPHGSVCAVCLPHAIAFNAPVTGGELAAMAAAIDCDFAAWVTEMLKKFEIVSPFGGVVFEDRDVVVAETLNSGSTKANPRPVTAADVEQLLDQITAV